MGFFDSNSKSSTSSSTTNQNAGFSEVSGYVEHENAAIKQGRSSKAVVVGDGALSLDMGNRAQNNQTTLNVLDGGAIAEAFDFAEDLSSKTTGSISEAIASVQESARTETESIMAGFQKILLWGAVFFGGVMIIKAFRG